MSLPHCMWPESRISIVGGESKTCEYGDGSVDWETRIEKATERRLAANQPIWDLIKEVKKSSDISDTEKEVFLAKLYGSLSDKDVTQALVSEAQKYHVGVSFRSSITDMLRTKRRMRENGVIILPGGNPKLKDREFGRLLGIRVPRTYAAGIRLSEIELIPNTIVKPVQGSSSKAVFYVDRALKLRSIRSSQIYGSLDEAKPEIEKHRAAVSINSWIIEEAILDSSDRPANDLKVYAFYGEAGMFLEIDRSSVGRPKNATFNGAGNPIGLGPRYETFPGTGLPDDIWKISEKLSLAAPVPFMRLDFHKGADGLYLGEITPHPGGTYAGQLFDSTDKMLGEHFANAKARLIIDLLQGKTFPEFQAVYEVAYDDSKFREPTRSN